MDRIFNVLKGEAKKLFACIGKTVFTQQLYKTLKRDFGKTFTASFLIIYHIHFVFQQVQGTVLLDRTTTYFDLLIQRLL